VSILISLLLVSFVVLIHELGHAIAMVRRGVQLDSFSIGMDLGLGLPKFTFRIRKLGGVRVIISPILIGGYVRTTADGARHMKKMSYADSAVISGAGIVANLVSGLLVCTFVSAIVAVNKGDWSHLGIYIPLVVACLIVAFRQAFCRYVILPIGIASIPFIVYVLIRHGLDQLGGIVMVIQLFSEMDGSASTPLEHLVAYANSFWIVSVGLAHMNTLPLKVLDGGHIAEAVMKRFHRPWRKRARAVYGILSTAAIVSLIWLVMVTDVARLVYGKF
jgi:membrane-associated protease RseP (regulator of RpoE activity)